MLAFGDGRKIGLCEGSFLITSFSISSEWTVNTSVAIFALVSTSIDSGGVGSVRGAGVPKTFSKDLALGIVHFEQNHLDCVGNRAILGM